MNDNAHNKASLADQAYAVLCEKIVTLAMMPGQRFTERQIVETTGLGAMPVREALDRLNAEGLVETIPRRGYRVAALTLKSAEDLFSIWSVIAPLIMELALANMTPEQAADLEAIRREHERAIRRRKCNPSHLIDIGRRRLNLLVNATNNPRLRRLHRTLSNEMDRILYAISSHSEEIREIFALSNQNAALVPSVEEARRFTELSLGGIRQVIIEKGFDYSAQISPLARTLERPEE